MKSLFVPVLVELIGLCSNCRAEDNDWVTESKRDSNADSLEAVSDIFEIEPSGEPANMPIEGRIIGGMLNDIAGVVGVKICGVPAGCMTSEGVVEVIDEVKGVVLGFRFDLADEMGLKVDTESESRYKSGVCRDGCTIGTEIAISGFAGALGRLCVGSPVQLRLSSS